jgi:HD-like signal output (HDOD) protein
MQGAVPFEGCSTAWRALRLMDEWAPILSIAGEVSNSKLLADGVVALARSAMYGGAHVRTVTQAIEYLGFVEVRRLALTLGISAWVRATKRSALYEPERLRHRMTVLAGTTEGIACSLELPRLYEYYEAGMYADIGFMFLAGHMPSRLTAARVAAMRPDGPPLLYCELEHCGCTHADVSATAAEMHGLPSLSIEAIAHHHSPWLAERAKMLADLLHVASVETDAALVTPVFGWPRAEHDPEAYDRVGIDQPRARELCEQAIERAGLYQSVLPARPAA